MGENYLETIAKKLLTGNDIQILKNNHEIKDYVFQLVARAYFVGLRDDRLRVGESLEAQNRLNEKMYKALNKYIDEYGK